MSKAWGGEISLVGTSVLIKGGRIIDPANRLDFHGDILVIDGLVTNIGEKLTTTFPIRTIDATGLVVAPGFVDLHTHLREPGFEQKETIRTGTKAAAAGGFTTLCYMPNTNPAIDNVEVLRWVIERVKQTALVRVYPIAAITRGRKGEELTDMESLSQEGAVAFSDDGDAVMDENLMTRALRFGGVLNKPIVQHSEDAILVDGGVMNSGEVARCLGLRGRPSVAESKLARRDIFLAEWEGAHLHIAHASVRDTVGLVKEAKARGVKVTCEVTPHHLTMSDRFVAGHVWPDGVVLKPLDTSTKVNPPLRKMVDVHALWAGLKSGVVDCIATDHAPHTKEDKRIPPRFGGSNQRENYIQAASGISNLETTLGSLLSLVSQGILTLTGVIGAMTYRAARVFGLPAGTLSRGANADVVIFDPNKEWVVDPTKFRSKGKNTPLVGSVLKGRVIHTIVGGKVVYSLND